MRSKLILWSLGGTCALLAIAAGYVASKPAFRPAPSGEFPRTAERIERGRYLANHVTGCVKCHSEADDSRWSSPPKSDALGGGRCYGPEACVPNITPHPEKGIGSWTDGEILRAIREGVDRNGKSLWVIHPALTMRNLSDGDGEAIVAYLRTLPPLAHERTWPPPPFPYDKFLDFIPEPLDGPVPDPDRKDTVAYGRYLTTIGNCTECHSPMLPDSDFDFRHRPVPGKEFSGGVPSRGGNSTSVNLTPHSTGLGNQTREQFITLFKAYDSPEGRQTPAMENLSTDMPWILFAGMTAEDLGAIYDYLRTLPPVENAVVRFTEAQETP